jgi:hypothetical protein
MASFVLLSTVNVAMLLLGVIVPMVQDKHQATAYEAWTGKEMPSHSYY